MNVLPLRHRKELPVCIPGLTLPALMHPNAKGGVRHRGQNSEPDTIGWVSETHWCQCRDKVQYG